MFQHPLLVSYLQQKKDLEMELVKLEQDTIAKLSKYKHGDLVVVRGKKVYVKSIGLTSYNKSGLAFQLVSPNKDGSMPLAGKNHSYHTCQGDIT